MENIKSIWYPNNVSDENKSSFTIGVNGVSKIERFEKNGEMALVGWFRILKAKTDGNAGFDVMAEIKESVCDIYFK